MDLLTLKQAGEVISANNGNLPIAVSTGSAQLGNMAPVVDVDTPLVRDVCPNMSLVFGSGRGIGSNNWVVSGSMTESGMPLLVNDPHLGIQMPSIWYEIGLHCQSVGGDCPLDVTGYTFAPTPGVIVGHNNFIAFV